MNGHSLRIWISYSTISLTHKIKVNYTHSADTHLQWIHTMSLRPSFVLSSGPDSQFVYVVVESGRITGTYTWRSIADLDVSLQRPALYL